MLPGRAIVADKASSVEEEAATLAPLAALTQAWISHAHSLPPLMSVAAAPKEQQVLAAGIRH